MTWDAIDFKNKSLTVNKSLECRYERGTWEAGPPKTEAGYRTIPLTSCVFGILSMLYDARKTRNRSKDYHVENNEEKEKVVKAGGKDRKVHKYQDEDSKRITTKLIEYMDSLNDDRIMILFDNYDKAVENLHSNTAD